jgi:hypothetical protein
VSSSILTRLSVGNVIVNYARSSLPSTPASASQEAAATQPARRENPGARRLESVRGQPVLTISRQDRSHAAMQAGSRRNRERPPIRHNGGQSSPSTLRAGPMILPKQLAPEFTRDLYFNMMQTSDGVHGLVVYSDVRHEAARIRKLIDDVFATMTAMKTTPNNRISKIK